MSIFKAEKYIKMKKNLLSISFIIAIALSACAQQRKVATKATSDATTQTQDNNTTPMDAGHITSLKMTRGGCFGKCPSYTVDLFSDGRVVYTSKMFTQYEGTFEKNVGAGKVQSLFKEFESYHVDTCGKYDNMIPDLPPLSYDIQFEKKKVEIRNARFGPKFLEGLSKQVDELAKVDDSWKKTAEPVKQ